MSFGGFGGLAGLLGAGQLGSMSGCGGAQQSENAFLQQAALRADAAMAYARGYDTRRSTPVAPKELSIKEELQSQTDEWLKDIKV